MRSSEKLHEVLEELEKLERITPGQRLPALREFERRFGSNSEFIEHALLSTKFNIPLKHRVVFVHGIRDDGDWFNATERLLKTGSHIEVQAAGIGYFNVSGFLNKKAREKACAKIVAALREAQDHFTVVSVVAHSFGTYCVTKAILENPDIRVFRLVLCGGIVSREFPWNSVKGELLKGRVLNECGNLDDIPIFAWRSNKTLFSDTGRFGFSRHPVRDRWHDIGHGGFLEKEFVSKYWVPFISGGEIVDSQTELLKPKWYVRWFSGRF